MAGDGGHEAALILRTCCEKKWEKTSSKEASAMFEEKRKVTT